MRAIFIFSLFSLSGWAVHPCQSPIPNRSPISEATLKELIGIIKRMPDSAFEKNDKYDVYSKFAPVLGPYTTMKKRRAAMAEIIRVLGTYESEWQWKAGIDRSNPSSSLDKCNEEAGALQTSGNTVSWGESFKNLFKLHCANYVGKSTCEKFIVCSKNDHGYVVEHTVMVLRQSVTHHGPIKRKRDVYDHLNPACMKYIEGQL